MEMEVANKYEWMSSDLTCVITKHCSVLNILNLPMLHCKRQVVYFVLQKKPKKYPKYCVTLIHENNIYKD